MATNQNGQYVDENHFNDSALTTGGAIQDRNIAQRQNYTNIATVSPYIFMDHSYFGTGGYRDGTYLIPFSLESAYQERRGLAHYKNYVRPVIDAMITPVFNESAIRTIEPNNSMFEAFLNNVDAAGTRMQPFAKVVMTQLRRHGISITVMDNYSSTAQPRTVADAVSDRVYPYIYNRSAHAVESYECDDFGNLKWIMFREPDAVYQLSGKTVRESRYRKWTETQSQLLTKSNNSNIILPSNYTKSDYRVIATASHNLGIVPVIILYSDNKEDRSTLLPDPPLYDIARINYQIYNMSAEIRDQERAQAFSVFYCQGVPPQDLAVGVNNYINIPESSSISPGYASPDWQIVNGLIGHEDKLRQDIYTIAEQNGVTGVKEASSGIALQWQFIGHESTLKDTSLLASAFESRVANLFKLYTNQQFDYTVRYKDSFSPVSIDNKIDRYAKLLNIRGLNGRLVKLIDTRIAELLTAGMSQEDIQTIIDEVAQSSTDTSAASQSQFYADPTLHS